MAGLYRFFLNNKVLIYVITGLIIILALLSTILLYVVFLLKRNKNQLETIFNNTQDALFLVNVENKTFRYYKLNAAYERLTGLTTGKIKGKTPCQAVGKELGKRIEANFRRCVEQKKTISYDEELEFQGKKMTWHTKLSPVIADGEVVQIVGVSRDITARNKMLKKLKRSEREYRSLFEESPIGLIKIDNMGKIIDVNKEMLDIFGSPGKEATLRLNVFELPQLKKAGLSNLYKHVIKNGRQISGEIHYTTYWGKKLWLNYFAKPILDEDGKVTEVIVACSDIGEKKEAEEKIKYLTFHDSLTGLYNRAYFNEELKRYDTQRQLPLSIIVGDVNGLKMTNDIFGHIEGDRLLIKAARMIKESCRQEDLVARWGGDEFVILLPNTGSEEAEKVCVRIKDAFKNMKAEPIKPEIALGCATKTEAAEDVYAVFRRAENLMYKNKLKESRSVQDAVISSLKKHLEKKTCETLSHCRRVKELALKLGEELKLSNSQLKDLAMLAELHDIGMVAVPEKILKKRDPLTDKEWEEVKTHPEMGYKIAVSFPRLISIAKGILNHHEWWDGSGYPQGLKMEEIPLVSRIIAVTDAFDVMTHESFYKKAKSRKEAVEELKKGAGSQFDPEIVDVFVNRVLTL